MKFANLKLLLFLLFFVSVWFMGTSALDPDFGWRLRSGLHYLEKGIPETDPYSYTMPSFPWVDHAWLVSTGIGFLYSKIGKVGLALITTTLAFLTLVISATREKKVERPFLHHKVLGCDLWYFGGISFLLSATLIMPFSGVRAQVVTWFMFAVFLRIFLDEKLWVRRRILIPFFFLIWANLHGGFMSGLATFFLVIVIRSIKKRKFELFDFNLLIISAFFSLYNPYGFDVWREVWSSVTDTSLRWSISEWMPSFFMADLSMMALITLSFAVISRYRRKIPLEELVLYFVFLIQGIASKRHLPLWMIVTLPILADSINCFYQEAAKNKISLFRFKKVYRYAWFLALFIFVIQLLFALKNSIALTEGRFYPKEGVEYLKKNQGSGEMFSLYGWGGYLIWEMPEKKVFIDGRMPSWRRDEAPEAESVSAFDDYKGILTGEAEYKELFEKYSIDTVFWPTPGEPGFYDALQKRLDKFLEKFGKEPSDYNFLEELENDGWDEVYKDNVSAIYKKPL